MNENESQPNQPNIPSSAPPAPDPTPPVFGTPISPSLDPSGASSTPPPAPPDPTLQAAPTLPSSSPPSTKKFNSFLAFIIAAGIVVVGIIVTFVILIFFTTRTDDDYTLDSHYSDSQSDDPSQPTDTDDDPYNQGSEGDPDEPEDPAEAALRRDNQRRADLDHLISQIVAFQSQNGDNVPNTIFNTLSGQPTLSSDAYFLNAFLRRNAGSFRDPTGVDWGFVTDSTGGRATIYTFAYSGPGFRCLNNNFTGENDLTGDPILLIDPRQSIAIRVRLENGQFVCRDLNTRVIPR